MSAERLRELAEKARPETKGRWRYRRCDFGHGPDPSHSYVEWGEPEGGLGTAALSVPMARYIAACSPDVVLRLLDFVEAARTVSDQALDEALAALSSLEETT